MNCVVCLRPVEASLDGEIKSCNDAVICRTTGNYGSTTIDSPPYVFEFVMCDLCVIRRRKYFVAFAERRQRPVYVPVDHLKSEYGIPEYLPENSGIKLTRMTTTSGYMQCTRCHALAATGYLVESQFTCQNCTFNT